MKLTAWICKIPKWMGGGHKRGVRLGTDTMPSGHIRITYRCPRCGATHTRKVKKEKA